MRLVHFSDSHLGYRQYQRVTPGGINQREADVAASFKRAIEKVIALAPELVVIAGDLFHNVRPTNPAILYGFQQLSRLTQALPDAIVVLVAGNHDSPRSSETGCILRLFSQIGVHVVDSVAQRLPFPEQELSILAVPFNVDSLPAFTPSPDARYNVLVVHRPMPGVSPHWATTPELPSLEITPEMIGPQRWSYVALGHHHVFTPIAPNACYSGSIDYTSANSWGEVVEERTAKIPGKGLIEYDLRNGKRTFHHLPASRALVDLPLTSARGMSATDLDAIMREHVDRCPGGIEDKIVRQIVRDVPRHIVREIDHKGLREFKRRALHFQLDTRRPEIIRAVGQGAAGKRPSLPEIVRDALRDRVLLPGIDRERLVTLGLQYLRDAEQVEATAAVAAGDGAE